MDIKQFAVEETGVLHLRGPNDEPLFGDDKLPMTVTVFGPGSKTYAKAQAARNNRMIDKLKKKGKTDTSAEEAAREQAEFLAECTREFSSNIQYDDLNLKGEALFRAVYADNSIGFVAEQVGRHLGEWGNFSKGSTTI